MNRTFTLSFALIAAFLIFTSHAYSQVFWTEDFGTGCNTGQLATDFVSANGSWTMTLAGTNQNTANTWFVSAAENGNEEGECGTGCGSDPTLHLGALNSFLGTDLGAAYYEGFAGLCSFGCGATNKRIESPTIDCSGKTGITVDFLYIEGGNTIDNATMWYFDGSTWTQIADMAKTFSPACNPQGLWTAYSIVLPASADNNAWVKIGFRWINNDGNGATDPSVAIDDIEVSTSNITPDVTPPVVICPATQSVNAGPSCNPLLVDYTSMATVTDDVDTTPTLMQSPAPGTPINGSISVTITASDDAGNSASCSFIVTSQDNTNPVLSCPNSYNLLAGANCSAVVPAFTSFGSVTDNCTPSGSITIVQSPIAGSFISNSTIMTVTATDVSDNSATCSFGLNISDSTPPVIACPSDFTVYVQADQEDGYAEIPALIASDNCGGIGVTNSFNGSGNASDTYPLGTTTVIYTVTDGNGNTSTCSFDVTVAPFECCPVDLNCDGFVGVADLLIFNANFGCLDGCLGDINGDGLVTIADLFLFTGAFGTYCP